MTHRLRLIVMTGSLTGLLAFAGPAGAQTGPPATTREGGQTLPAASPAVAGRDLLMGGVPSGTVSADPISLSLHDVLTRGLEHNLAAVVGEQRVRQADAARWAAWSGLLPNVSASLLRAEEQINLEAYGFPVAPGQSPIIGPFSVSDRRIAVSQTVFSYAAIESAKNGSAMKSAAGFANQDLRGQIVSALTAMYLQLAATRGRIDAARAQLRTAQVLYDHAVSLKQAGAAAGIETTRAQVQVENQKQRVIYFENELAKQKLQLARAIGLPLGQAFDLGDRFPYSTLDTLTPDTAIQQALDTRADFKSAQELVKAATAARQAAVGSMLPSVGVAADVGAIGPSWSTAQRTFSAAAAVSVPIFQSGRERSRLIAADASLKQEEAQLADLRAKIEFEVRAALLDVSSADQRVRVAQSAFDLATLQLTQAEDRFVAGVANHVEVVQAQEAVATATDNLISSRLDHSLAKAALARALGLAESGIERFVGGQQ
jgi:outer membrane protein TolC